MAPGGDESASNPDARTTTATAEAQNETPQSNPDAEYEGAGFAIEEVDDLGEDIESHPRPASADQVEKEVAQTAGTSSNAKAPFVMDDNSASSRQRLEDEDVSQDLRRSNRATPETENRREKGTRRDFTSCIVDEWREGSRVSTQELNAMARSLKRIQLANDNIRNRPAAPAAVPVNDRPKTTPKRSVFDMLADGDEARNDRQIRLGRSPYAPHQIERTVEPVYDDPRNQSPFRSRSSSPPHHGDRVQQGIHIKKHRTPANTSIHMSLDVEEDLQVLLQEATTLRRLGHFKKAIALFEQRLGHHLQTPYVKMMYSQCLFAAGQYKTLEVLAEMTTDPSEFLEIDLYWILVRITLLLSPDDESPKTENIVNHTTYLILDLFDSKWSSHYNSLEIQVFCLALETLPPDSFQSFDFHFIYRRLLSNELVWEFRDFLYSLEDVLDFPERLRRMLSIKDTTHANAIATGIDILCEDWDYPLRSEGVSFAVLEIFTHLALCCMEYKLQARTVDICMGVARQHTEFLLGKKREHINTRPCLLWMMAKNIRKVYGSGFQELTYFDEELYTRPNETGSITVFKYGRSAFPFHRLTVCVPRRAPMPPWKPFGRLLPDTMKRTTRVVLEAAENLSDVPLQIACWSQIVYQEPDLALYAADQVIELCRQSGCVTRAIQTTLFKRMLVHDSEEEARLYDQVLELTADPDLERGGITSEQYAAYVVLESLATTEAQRDMYSALAKECKGEAAM